MYSLLDFFTDPVLRGPTLGCMLMSFASSLIGTLSVLRKRSLLGEALSHAAYPGIALAVVLLVLFLPHASDEFSTVVILSGAFLFSFLGLFVIDLLEKRFRIPSDAALCAVLSLFFGGGVLLASRLQISQPLAFQQIQLFLYGQAATLRDEHVILYGALALFVLFSVIIFYRPLQVLLFDRSFAESSGMRARLIDLLFSFLTVLAIVIGMRSVGVVLMSGMLIAPAVAARWFCKRLSTLLIVAAAFGLFSGFIGNYLSVTLPPHFSFKASLATGPMILLSAFTLALFALLLSPQRGLVGRAVRRACFRFRCKEENILKSLWRKDGRGTSKDGSRFQFFWLVEKRLVEKQGKEFVLTERGREQAQRIVRLHRLWEAYLVFMGHGVEKVHTSAEEMEHILTPELEKALTGLLQNPTHDPHQQPIPEAFRPQASRPQPKREDK